MKIQTIIAPLVNPGSLPKDLVQQLNGRGIEINAINLLDVPVFEDLLHFGFIITEVSSHVVMHLLGSLRGSIIHQTSPDNITIVIVGTMPEWRSYFAKNTEYRKVFRDLFAGSKMGRYL